MTTRKQFDYYIYIDYSENLIGYMIIRRENLACLLPKISRFRHFKEVRQKQVYLKNIRNRIKKECILSFLERVKVRERRLNMEIFIDVLGFLKKHDRCLVLVSVDDSEYSSFRKMVSIVNDSVVVKKESELVENTPEYMASLVLDNILNIERLERLNYGQ